MRMPPQPCATILPHHDPSLAGCVHAHATPTMRDHPALTMALTLAQVAYMPLVRLFFVSVYV